MKHRISPYTSSLTLVFWSLVLFTDGLMVTFCIRGTRGMSLAEAAGTGIFQGVLLILAITAVLLGIFLHNGYEYFGTVQIRRDGLVFRAFLRKPVILLYDELHEVGIDYGFLSPDHRQFWVYFSKIPVETRYTHNILRLPYSQNAMRIQYRPEVYKALLNAMPEGKVKKQLLRSHSVITLHGAESGR